MNARRPPSFAGAIRALALQAQAKTARRSRAPIPVFVAYADVASARNALDRFGASLRQTHGPVELHPMLWRFAQLDDPRWREMALRDAATATTVVLAMSDEAAFCGRTEAWLTSLLVRRRGASINVWTLIGESEPWTMTLAQPGPLPAPGALLPLHDPAPAAREVFASVVPKRTAACAA